MSSLDFDFLKDRYDFELERKNKLTGDLTLPVGVLSGLGGLVATMARSFTYRVPLVTAVFAVCIGLTVFAFVICLVFLGKAYHGQTYKYLPLLADLETTAETFHDFNTSMQWSSGDVDDDFRAELRRRIIKAADRNTLSNDPRSKWMHFSRITLFFLLGLTALAVVPYVADQRLNARNTMPSPQVPVTQTPTAAPKRPTMPENRVIKEGHEVGNPKT